MTLVCFDPQVHLNRQDDAESEERARQAAEREMQAARLAAAEARRDFTIALVRKGTADAGSGLLVGQLLANRHYYVRLDDAAVAQLLGIKPDTFNGAGAADAIAAFAAQGTRNAQRAVYAAGLALGESTISGPRYDTSPAARRAYLDHLVGLGYQLNAFETDLIAEGDGSDDDEDYEDDAGPAEGDEAGAGGEA